MYGLVNQAVEDLAVELGGQALWQRIKQHAGVTAAAFVAMAPYDDALTYRLVDAASAVLGMPPEAVLTAFGEHWVVYTGRQGYGPLFAVMGSTLPEFLRNLDAMHGRIAVQMPTLQPPSFRCEELDRERLLLHYTSTRSGLVPMVRGLLTGLGTLFDVPVTVTDWPQGEQDGSGHVFLVTHGRPSGLDRGAGTHGLEPSCPR